MPPGTRALCVCVGAFVCVCARGGFSPVAACRTLLAHPLSMHGGRVARRIYRGAPLGAGAVPTSRRYYVNVEATGEGFAISRRRGPAEVSRGKGSLLIPLRRRSSNGPLEVTSLAGFGGFLTD